MIPITEKMRDILNVLGALFWLVLVIVSWARCPVLSYVGLLAVAVLSVIYFILGTSGNGTIGVKVPLVYPVLMMGIFWIIAFTAAYRTRGQVAAVWILGLHPGQFWTLLFFWIGTFLTSTLSYALYFDSHILPGDDWESFLEDIKKMKLDRTSPE